MTSDPQLRFLGRSLYAHLVTTKQAVLFRSSDGARVLKHFRPAVEQAENTVAGITINALAAAVSHELVRERLPSANLLIAAFPTFNSLVLRHRKGTPLAGLGDDRLDHALKPLAAELGRWDAVGLVHLTPTLDNLLVAGEEIHVVDHDDVIAADRGYAVPYTTICQFERMSLAPILALSDATSRQRIAERWREVRPLSEPGGTTPVSVYARVLLIVGGLAALATSLASEAPLSEADAEAAAVLAYELASLANDRGGVDELSSALARHFPHAIPTEAGARTRGIASPLTRLMDRGCRALIIGHAVDSAALARVAENLASTSTKDARIDIVCSTPPRLKFPLPEGLLVRVERSNALTAATPCVTVTLGRTSSLATATEVAGDWIHITIPT